MCDSCGCSDVPDSKQRTDTVKMLTQFRGIPVVSGVPVTRERIQLVPAKTVPSTQLNQAC